MVFSEVRCQGCELCTSLCPLSVPKLHEYPDHLIYSQIEDLLSGDLDRKVILFACSERAEALNAVGMAKIKYPGLLLLFVPYIDLVSEAHILCAFAFRKKKFSGMIDFAKPKRDILYELLHNLYMKTGVSPTLIEENTEFPFADVAIGPKCRVCNACENERQSYKSISYHPAQRYITICYCHYLNQRLLRAPIRKSSHLIFIFIL